jgi:AraC-like DNA-binding protein/tetratricopeptide (TPR) repeat protein
MRVQRSARAVTEQAVQPRCVKLALNAMRAAPQRALKLPVLAAIAGASTRTLQRQFQKFVGKAPLAALRDIRFEYARRELLRGSSHATVAETAHRCGFTHFGRFSVEYHRRYGEKPSQTLQRQARVVREPQRRTHVLSSASDRATVAVLSIAATGGVEAIARAVTEELAIALMRAGIAVTNRPEMARYHVCASLRRDGREVRLTSRLIEPATGRHLWAHCHDGTVEDAFFFEERAAASVAAAIQPGLRAAEIERVRCKPGTDLNAQDLTLRALPHVLSLEVDGNGRALDLLGRAIDSDPNHALAIALSAWCFTQRAVYLFGDAPAGDRLRALSLARRDFTGADDATVFAVLGHAFSLANDLEAADLVTQKALRIDGSSAWAWSRSGLLDIYKGRPGSATERLWIALDLAPDDPLAFNAMNGVGLAYFQSGRLVEAAHWWERAVAERPSAVFLHQFLCPAYALCGDKQGAYRSLAVLQRRCPGLTISRVFAANSFFPRAFLDSIGNGLETVGLPP